MIGTLVFTFKVSVNQKAVYIQVCQLSLSVVASIFMAYFPVLCSFLSDRKRCRFIDSRTCGFVFRKAYISVSIVAVVSHIQPFAKYLNKICTTPRSKRVFCVRKFTYYTRIRTICKVIEILLYLLLS